MGTGTYKENEELFVVNAFPVNNFENGGSGGHGGWVSLHLPRMPGENQSWSWSAKGITGINKRGLAEFSIRTILFLHHQTFHVIVETQTTAGVHVSFLQENRYVSPVSIMESEFFCSHLYDLSFFYHFHPFRVHFSDECFFIYPSSPLFPPVVLYQTPIITAEDPYVFPERSILEDQKKKKASVPGPSDTEIAPDCVQQAEDLALKNAAVFWRRRICFRSCSPRWCPAS